MFNHNVASFTSLSGVRYDSSVFFSESSTTLHVDNLYIYILQDVPTLPSSTHVSHGKTTKVGSCLVVLGTSRWYPKCLRTLYWNWRCRSKIGSQKFQGIRDRRPSKSTIGWIVIELCFKRRRRTWLDFFVLDTL